MDSSTGQQADRQRRRHHHHHHQQQQQQQSTTTTINNHNNNSRSSKRRSSSSNTSKIRNTHQSYHNQWRHSVGVWVLPWCHSHSKAINEDLDWGWDGHAWWFHFDQFHSWDEGARVEICWSKCYVHAGFCRYVLKIFEASLMLEKNLERFYMILYSLNPTVWWRVFEQPRCRRSSSLN